MCGCSEGCNVLAAGGQEEVPGGGQAAAAGGGARSGGADEQEKRTFLSLEEAGLVEMSGLSTHERFLCRLTVSPVIIVCMVVETTHE